MHLTIGPYRWAALLLLLGACSRPTAEAPATAAAEEGSYFSTRQFLDDQLLQLQGSMYTAQKIIFLNGRTDTSYVALTKENWTPVYAAFEAMDISAPKYAGKYRFTNFVDAGNLTANYVYEALEPKLPVRRLMITADQETQRISSIIGDWEQNGFWSSRRQRLYYVPMGVLQLQDEVHAKIGTDKTFRIDYRFLVNRNDADE